jgi:hypothetical protein
MISRNQSSRNILQNSLSAGTFALIFAAQLLAYLLYVFPSSEILWTLNLPLRRLVAPLLVHIQGFTGLGPVALLVLLGAVVLMPVAATMRRSWLGTASCAHMALGIFVLLTAYAVQREATGFASASLQPAFVASRMGFSSISLAIMTIVFVALCIINHIVFFARTSSAK